MILDGRSRRFGITIPWASYCMLRPYVSSSLAAAETGRIVGRAQSVQADILVPTVLHTLQLDELPRSLTPKAVQLTSLPPDAFVAYFFVVRLLDGRTLRGFHRFSEVKDYVAQMTKALGRPLIEVGWFPWRNVHHSMVNVEQRRGKLEGYMRMLFDHNTDLQSHPLTLAFFACSGAADLSVGVAVPPPRLTSKQAARRGAPAAAQGGAGNEPVTARAVVSPSKRLVTVVVDVELAAGLGDPEACARTAAQKLVQKLAEAVRGDDASELRVLSLEGVAPLPVARACGEALASELGAARGRPALCDEPNLQLLRALHHVDASGRASSPPWPWASSPRPAGRAPPAAGHLRHPPAVLRGRGDLGALGRRGREDGGLPTPF